MADHKLKPDLLPTAVLQKHLPQNGLLPLLDREGEEGKHYVKNKNMYYVKNKNNDYKSNGNGNVFQQNTYYNTHRTVEQYKKNSEDQQVEGLRQLVGET